MSEPTSAAAEAHYEFDREPVSADRLLGPGHFAASFAGEHVAATEFVIGASFVSWGAAIGDVFVGLAVGNLLAVLNWALLCAPVAVDTRLTLYWYLRRIGGPAVTAVANVLNALLYCVLAGAMITVAASAVRIPFGIPAQTGLYPTDARFVLVVVAVGGLVTWLAIAGFRRLADFAMVCAPWMFLMFLVGALAVLPRLGEAAGVGAVGSLAEFWQVGESTIWTGRTPDGAEGLSFWHVAAFAWVCNLAMNAGLSDMALLRYAPNARYGLFSIFGTFLGHYVAWIAAGVMGAGAAVLMGNPLTEIDSGGVAYAALGWAGALAVVIAGWTTSNPTIYRAGLALQAVTRNGSRTRITLGVGVVTTGIACFPFVFSRLLDFVGVYGLVLCPAGAIVLTEHWWFPRLGLRRYWAEARGALNVPALVAWLGSLVVAFALNRAGVHLFFLFVPTYLVAVGLYVVLAARAGAEEATRSEGAEAAPLPPAPPVAPAAAPVKEPDRMAALWGVVALAALAVCFWLGLRVALGGLDGYTESHDALRRWIGWPTVVYFAAGTMFVRARERR
ncbi:MAG: hypothetical protein QGG24_00870 [Vicinamibacterales bacterium]|jgi:NCS1 family nucleobase:cation symporter-1|nr:nucleoside transporter [Acidobacteriota bacterium]MDP7293847.1 hypothetical protein [Vicinamibacterales bacterium]MDP7671220.1 hypothetical protein [Vicinamibacterales bacterium]HJO38424.1 hypothetical protein [Vicinamibacterales bacterium]